jgi:hypothetical protein
VGSCEHGNEPSGSIKCCEILEQLSDWWLLKKDTSCRLKQTEAGQTDMSKTVLEIRRRGELYHGGNVCKPRELADCLPTPPATLAFPLTTSVALARSVSDYSHEHYFIILISPFTHGEDREKGNWRGGSSTENHHSLRGEINITDFEGSQIVSVPSVKGG